MQVMQRLNEAGLPTQDISDIELAQVRVNVWVRGWLGGIV